MKNKIQLDHNIKKLSRQRKFERALKNERIHNEQMFPYIGTINTY